MEEVNFSIEINGLMSLKKGISGQGSRPYKWAMNCAVPFVCSIGHPLGRGRTKGRDWETAGEEGREGDVVSVCVPLRNRQGLLLL